MRAYLRVKIKSLAAEAAIIRAEERRARRPELRVGLRDHRVHDVRREARASQLALAAIRGVPVLRLEASATTAPQWDRVEAMVRKYGEGDLRDRMQNFSEWKAQHPTAAPPAPTA